MFALTFIFLHKLSVKRLGRDTARFFFFFFFFNLVYSVQSMSGGCFNSILFSSPCCQSAGRPFCPAPSRLAQSPGTSTQRPSSLVLELLQWEWLGQEPGLGQFSAASSSAMPGNNITSVWLLLFFFFKHRSGSNNGITCFFVFCLKGTLP